MAKVRSVDFLPEIFQTDANKQFLAATLDQLIQEPSFKKTQGFIGRTVGPGINPNDKYVIEPTATRANYQLEPGVVSLVPETDTIKNAITYPGLNDAIGFQGGISSRPDLLYSSDYYSWDPFVDFDTFVNFSQYFWLPDGPAVVDVSATEISTTDNFVVNRENGVYTFSGVDGENPAIELIRGGSYTFQVAQNQKETVNYRVQNLGISAYVIDGQSNPALTLARGNTYVFNLTLGGVFPFWIKTAPVTGQGQTYNSGVTRNGAATGLITFVVPQDAPDTLYYASENQQNMQGVLNIVNNTPGTGPGFWIQTAPGVGGDLPFAPNISSRDVVGVTNNGEDLGTVVFNVPQKTAQNFYYNLTSIGTIDIVTSMNYDDINGQPLVDFIIATGGIDGTTNLNTRTLVFVDQPEYVNKYQITYNTVDGIDYLQVSEIATINTLEKFTILFGITYSNTQWYKTPDNKIQQIPLLTAAQDTLYYQDGTDPEIFGIIKLSESTSAVILDIDQIIGKKNYISPNGVAFTNGLKVKFTGEVTPISYKSGTTTLVCTQTAAGTNYITSSGAKDLYVGQEILFLSPTLGGITVGQTYYVRTISANKQKFTISETKNGIVVTLELGTGTMNAIAISDHEYYVSGVGTAIELLPVDNFTIYEPYAEDSATQTFSPTKTDYLTISRASKDLNAWTRSNRWFHIDVINATAEYNKTSVNFDNNYRAKRPIIQFRSGIRLWDMGTEGKAPVDIIDLTQTDAFSNVEGSTSYTVDGYTFVEGSRVIFAVDEDENVRNKIYIVNFATPDTVEPLIAQPIIILTQADDGAVEIDQCTVCINGNTLAGLTFWYDGIEWIQAQQKTNVQQAPLFNVYDRDNISFGNQIKYPSSNFTGSKLFSYAVGDTTILDPILQLPLQYLNINNVGDIVFDNNLYVDTFIYVVDNVSVTQDISSGAVQQYAGRTAYKKLIGWQSAVVPQQIYQQFKFTYTGATLKLDVEVNAQSSIAVPVIKIYIGSIFLDPGLYTYTVGTDSTVITLTNTYLPTDVIEVAALSSQPSKVGFYQVPDNLQSNPLNANSPAFTLGTIRTHYESICQNLITLTGKINGSNNTRDLGNIIPYGLTILQQSSPLTLAGYFMRSPDFNIFASLQYNSREYIKYKAKMLDAVLTQENIAFKNTANILDTAIQDITFGKVDTQPFYWSDMLPTGVIFASNNYTVGYTTQPTFDTVQVYDFKSANYLGLCVYLNDVLLERGRDYTVSTNPTLTILVTLNIGDVVTINEYNATYGSFVPNTPTKLGLYPAFRPAIVSRVVSNGVTEFIQGHDGSLTPLFGDIRDAVLLEFETRIYSNLKLDDNPVPMTLVDVLPGEFRDTGYTYEQINNIFAGDFLSYCGWNKLDYKQQDYSATNEFTWNYSNVNGRLDNQPLLGAWRGIYRYYYDTEQPSYTPWEMLGFAVEPDWWENTYGPAPYTADNMNLWDDLEAGYVADPIAPYYKSNYARPGLTTVIPTGSEGELLSPLNSVAGTAPLNYSLGAKFNKSWALGDGGPVEASWWNSSAYAFSVMHVLAVTRPAKFFALFADRDLYKFDTDYDQYLYNQRYRLNANNIEVYGNGISKASYIDWIVDFNRQIGIDSTAILTADLDNLDVRLCYRMASYSDKQYIKVFTEKSSPNSTNTTLMIPDESYDIVLYKNQPFDSIRYSAVAVQKVSGGYAVFGYGTTQAYFEILQSQAVGRLQEYSAGGITVRVPTFYTDTVVQVPYGFVFSNETAVSDFLLSYNKLLETQGLTFTDRANGYMLDWPRMVDEFLYWSQQGWNTDAIINLNPLAGGLTVTRAGAIVDNITTETTENLLLDQNSRELPTRTLNIIRTNNTFTIQPLTTQNISFIDLRFTNYEHMIVLSNKSAFGDLIYDPTTGARQNRLNLVAVTTADWNGTIDTPGFILNQNNVEEWTGLRTYSKGELVKYKNVYWSALKIVQPGVKFNFDDWTQSNYTQTEIGLLPNIANKANQLVNSYNINTANIELDNDLLSYGLIGFKPRQYMAALNLDDVSQVNVYKQFLDTKGTILSAELFKSANLSKEAADYTIYENWAVQRAIYGANANRSFFELRLDRALLSSNPSLVQVIVPGQESLADQTIFLSDVWKQSYKLTSPNILPTTTELPTDTGLPTAGYVNVNDADIKVFDISNNSSLNANIDSIEVGTSIWVAKINNYDWNIYRAQAVPGQIQHVCDNLNGTSRVIFSGNHGLVAGNKLIIKFFDVEINGVYQVLSVLDLTTVNIAFAFSPTSRRTVANGTGIGLTLQTMRVSQASDVVNLPYANDILPGARVWIDNNGDGLWEVLEKNTVFSSVVSLEPQILAPNEQYGASVAQGRNQAALLVGSPNYNSSHGGVYVYVPGYDGQYISPLEGEDAILSLSDPVQDMGDRGFGNAIDFGNRTWAVAGASASLSGSPTGNIANTGSACVVYRDPVLGGNGSTPYTTWQLLNPLGGGYTGAEFGYSVAMSLDERWMYIGAPGYNSGVGTVYAYGYVDWQEQSTSAVADGATTTYIINNAIQINDAWQVQVTVNTVVQTPGVDFTVAGNFSTVTFTTPPADGLLIKFARWDSFQLPLLTATFDLAHGIDDQGRKVGLFNVKANNIDSFSVKVNTVLWRPNIDYTLSGTTLTFVTTLGPGDYAVVSSKGYYTLSATLNPVTYGITSGLRVGQSVSCSTDGRQVIIGASNSTVSSKTEAGEVFVFNRNVQKFVKNDDSTNAYTVLGTISGPISVLVNNQFLINQTNSVISTSDASNSFTVYGNTVTIYKTLNVGDIIEIETNYFPQPQVVTQNTVAEFCNFGSALDMCSNDCSIYVGEPQSSQQIFKGGVVERFVNQSRIYGTITATVANPTLIAGDTISINNFEVEVPASNPTVQGLADQINGIPVGSQTGVPNVLATVSASGYLTLSVKNPDATSPFNKLQVAPGAVSYGNGVFSLLGLNNFVWTQTIESPYPVEYAGFGSSLNIDDSAVNLVVGCPKGSLYLITIFDDGTTFFDAGTTIFFSLFIQSGAVYTYDYLPSSTSTLSNPGKFVFGQQVNNTDVAPYDAYGTAVNYTSGFLVAGAPKNDAGDSSLNYGAVFVFENSNKAPAWGIKQIQQPTVDVRLLNSVFLYDKITGAKTEFLDFINPLQGKILGAAKQNINYIGAIDPASYNIGSNNIRGTTWFADHVGEVWWDTSTVRFIDPNQDNITYASRRWAQLFPGSVVDVYQWVVSSTPPSNYTGEGTPYSTLSYTLNTRLTKDGTFATEYYFWVRDITVTSTKVNKTLPISTIASYITDPKASGIPYMAPINSSTIALYNSANYIAASDTVVSIEFDRELTDDNVHVEYELFPQDNPDGILSDNLYLKSQDSFCGVDSFGNKVPDPKLTPADRYGALFRPRQSTFVDRFEALRNYLTRANKILAQYPITEIRTFQLLGASEPEPPQTEIIDGNTITNWNLQVDNLEILGFQNIYSVPLGYKYLVNTDSSQRGLWTIYTVETSDVVVGERILKLTQVQGYNTPAYWSYIDWVKPGYNAGVKILTKVPAYSALATLSVPVGSSVEVIANAQGQYEIYLLTDIGWERVVLQNGTVEISAEIWDYQLGRFGFDIEVFDAQYFDQEPTTETRYIIRALNEEILIDELAIERNRLITLMFNFVLSEFSAPEWLVKTSLIDVNHRIRQLIPYQNYVRDNQEFVLDYIKEVKPYHVTIREFNLQYDGFGKFFGDMNDFDLPAYYNTSLITPKYTSPILLPYAQSDAFNSALTTESNVPSISTLWSDWPYNQWYNNYLLKVTSVTVITSGSGYTNAPTVVFTGDAVVPATGVAIINSFGQVASVVITDGGSGYSATPTVTFSGGNGVGVVATGYTVMNYDVVTSTYTGLVRSIKTTIKYDRFQYFSDVQDWNESGTYRDGTLVRYDNRVWKASSLDSTAVVGPNFNLEDWKLVPARELSGIDRTQGYYVPGVNEPGMDLPLLIDGIAYPGVQVYGNYFLGDPTATDAIYQSEFTDATLGKLPSDINVDGGEFIGLYEGHSPEELVNGAEFDTLDMRVYTRPGADWNRDGHGFQTSSIRYTYNSVITDTFSWAGVVNTPVQVLVSNMTTNLDLTAGIDYTIDWDHQTITVLEVYNSARGNYTVANGDLLNINVYEIGGGSQLYRANYMGENVGSSVVIPVNSSEILSLAIFVNGAITSGATWEPYTASTDWNINDSYVTLDVVNYEGVYYRALQDTIPGITLNNFLYWLEFTPILESLVDFGTTYGVGDGISLTAFGVSTIDAGYFVIGRQYTITELGTTNFVSVGAASNTVGVTFTATGVGSGTGKASTNYEWSTPQSQTFIATAATVSTKTITLTNSMQGTNPANLIVTQNGKRLIPAAGIEWIGDDSSVSFGLPQRITIGQDQINPATDITVWIDNILQPQTYGLNIGTYIVTPWTGSNTPGRQVVFSLPPPSGAIILISESTQADYSVVSNQLTIAPIVNLNDIFNITTWNDTSQQFPLTMVFIGPTVTGLTLAEGFASTNYSPASADNYPGSFDYAVGIAINTNNFYLERTGVLASRLWVTLDGYRLFEGRDFIVTYQDATDNNPAGDYLILSSGIINSAQVLVVTEFTSSIVPDAIAFRIFQDMRGVQATYRITLDTTTILTQDLSATDDIIYVQNSLALAEPNLSLGKFGVIIIDGERIMYRVRNVALNTVSGLFRGTAGTAAADHITDTNVYNMNRVNLLPEPLQNYIVSDSSTGDGSTTIFYAPSIDVGTFDDSTVEVDAIEVYVGGIRQYAYSDTSATSQYRWVISQFDPVAIEFVVDGAEYPALEAPPAGIDVTILVRQCATTWYQLGVGTPSNGIALQDTDTQAARFLRGL